MVQSGTVKWYNPQKGFGFIQLQSGDPDIFVHKSEVEKAGLTTLAEGQKIWLEVGVDRKDKRCAKDLSLKEGGISARDESAKNVPAGRENNSSPIASKSNRCHGRVKWFNVTKAYGFIVPEGGGEDVFVHITEVNRAGLDTLTEGQKVSYFLQPRGSGKVYATALEI